MSYDATPRMTAIIDALTTAVMDTTNAAMFAAPFGQADEDEDPKRINAYPALNVRHTAEIPQSPNQQKVAATVNLDIFLKHADPSEKSNAIRQQADSLRKFIRLYRDPSTGQGNFGAKDWVYGGWQKKSGVSETGESVDILTLNYTVEFTEDNL